MAIELRTFEPNVVLVWSASLGPDKSLKAMLSSTGSKMEEWIFMIQDTEGTTMPGPSFRM
jgi:hypothetical protein